MAVIATVEALEALYGPPVEASLVKEADHATPHYRVLIEASPFLVLATAGPEGLDCSPRGDRPGELVRVSDDGRTLWLPDRRGNNRVDSLRNVVRDPRCALLFLIPGSGTTLRANGRAHLDDDPDLLASFAVDGKPPRLVLVFRVEVMYFQCARAVARSALWDAASRVDPAAIPSPGAILAGMTASRVGGETYDRAWPERAAATMW